MKKPRCRSLSQNPFVFSWFFSIEVSRAEVEEEESITGSKVLEILWTLSKRNGLALWVVKGTLDCCSSFGVDLRSQLACLFYELFWWWFSHLLRHFAIDIRACLKKLHLGYRVADYPLRLLAQSNRFLQGLQLRLQLGEVLSSGLHAFNCILFCWRYQFIGLIAHCLDLVKDCRFTSGLISSCSHSTSNPSRRNVSPTGWPKSAVSLLAVSVAESKI